MALVADVPLGPRRRERLFDINNPAGWVGFKVRRRRRLSDSPPPFSGATFQPFGVARYAVDPTFKPGSSDDG